MSKHTALSIGRKLHMCDSDVNVKLFDWQLGLAFQKCKQIKKTILYVEYIWDRVIIRSISIYINIAHKVGYIMNV